MIIIRKYGIELHSLQHDDIEIVRQARNRADIRATMFDQQIVTPAQQEQWFQSINNAYNFYAIIHHQQKKIGLIYGKNIDYENHEEEGGIFIWDNACLGTGIPAKASIIMMQLSFAFSETEKIYARVRADNIPAQRFNQSLGYVKSEREDYMVLTRSSYEHRLQKLVRLATGKGTPDFLTLNDIEITDIPHGKERYSHLPRPLYNKIMHHYMP